MALRCKDLALGEAACVLNFPRTDYAALLPLMDKLSRVGAVGWLQAPLWGRGGV